MQKLQKEKETSEKLKKSLNLATICSNCNGKKKDTLFFPCLHLGVCNACSQNMSNCNTCNQTIDGKLLVNL